MYPLYIFILLLLFHHVHSLTFPSDIKSLQSLISSINPTSIPPYSCLASWNFTSDPCTVPYITHFTCGLSCTDNRVTRITLDPAGYSGVLPATLSGLTQLAVLDLSDNAFHGPIPPSLFSLPNIQTLVLRSNSFSGNLPPSLAYATSSLQSLDLSRNSLSGPLPPTISSLSGLTRLDLSFNRFSGPIPRLPPNLLELTIKANSLWGPLQRTSFAGLNQLEVVELSDNSLSDTIPDWFFRLPSLQQVDLANNSFTRVEIRAPGNPNGDLVAVDLGFNRLIGTLPVNFVGFPMLSSLSLRYNRFRGRIPWEYGKKESLKRLYLDGNFLSGMPPQGLVAGGSSVAGSLGDNCLQRCPKSSQLCLKAQKPTSICQQSIGGKPKQKPKP